MSSERLARRIGADVADVRVRLEEAVLRTDALLASGQPERAAAVLDEQEALLAELRDTLSSSVAAAAVEAAAEAVLVEGPEAARLFGDGREVRPLRRRLRTTASAVVSAAAAIAFAVMASSPPGPQTLAAAGVDREASAAPRPDGSPNAAPEARDGVTGRAIGPNELSIRRLFSASPTPGAPDDAPTTSFASGLSELQALVDGLLATVVRAAGDLTDRSDGAGSLDRADATSRPVVTRPADGGAPEDTGPARPADEPESEPRDETATPAPEGGEEGGEEPTGPTLPVPGSLEGSELSPND